MMKGYSMSILAVLVIVALAAVAAVMPSAYAQTWGKPETMVVAAIPLIVGLGVGLAYFIGISARRSHK
jgi:protein-S-isoprenylcysteine O-methyltransferase Ste14